MTDFSKDPFNNIIQEGIKGDIEFCMEHDRFRAVVSLTYAAIDQMAFLNMPDGQLDVKGNDFMTWVDKYIDFNDPKAPTSLELWGARCAALHQYGIESRVSRTKGARLVVTCYRVHQTIVHEPQAASDIVIVPIEILTKVTCDAIDKFMVAVHTNQDLRDRVEPRLLSMNCDIPERQLEYYRKGGNQNAI